MVEIVPYRPCWPAEFQAIAGDLRRELGETAVRIDHIGSTSVPGLDAKDIIDVQITVAQFDGQLVECLLALGYTQPAGISRDHRPPMAVGPESDWEKMFFRHPAAQRPSNTHVRLAGRPNQRYALLFRDHLRAHPATAAAYAELKRRLAAHLADPARYPEVKDPAVDLIYFAAEAWAATAGWQPGPSDA
ncbi:MAG: GrpB family protein [Anaerolineales bacterium]|nr:GrpB family protein [Anaerolineales bacterium]